MLIWGPDPDYPATVGQGLPHGLVAIIGNEAISGVGHVWLLNDDRGAVISVGIAASVDAAQDEIVARAMVFSEQERKPGRKPSALRGMSSFNRNHRRNVRIAALDKANRIVRRRIEDLYGEMRSQLKPVDETRDRLDDTRARLDETRNKLYEIRDSLQLTLCDMAIIALAESVRRYSTIFERYLELPSSVVDIISKGIESRADELDSLASGPMVEDTPNSEMVWQHLQYVSQRLEEIRTSLRQEGFLIDRELLTMAQGYCVMHRMPAVQKSSPTPLATSVRLDSMIAQAQAMEHFYRESREFQEELISCLIAAQFQYKQYYNMIKASKN